VFPSVQHETKESNAMGWATYLEHRFEALSSHEPIVDAFPDQTAHTDGPKVIEI
jgi:hypothetical protein